MHEKQSEKTPERLPLHLRYSVRFTISVSFFHGAKIDLKIAASSQYIMSFPRIRVAAFVCFSHVVCVYAHRKTSAIIYDFIAFDALPIIKLLSSNHMLHLYCMYFVSLPAIDRTQCNICTHNNNMHVSIHQIIIVWSGFVCCICVCVSVCFPLVVHIDHHSFWASEYHLAILQHKTISSCIRAVVVGIRCCTIRTNKISRIYFAFMRTMAYTAMTIK